MKLCDIAIFGIAPMVPATALIRTCRASPGFALMTSGLKRYLPLASVAVISTRRPPPAAVAAGLAGAVGFAGGAWPCATGRADQRASAPNNNASDQRFSSTVLSAPRRTRRRAIMIQEAIPSRRTAPSRDHRRYGHLSE